jgi:predicted NUDIX family NTP pyrophosphohydrolase
MAMPKKISAGILMYRIRADVLEVLLVHPGGPLWARKDAGAWTIPKGGIDDDADALEAAKREFAEETGSPVDGEFLRLTPLRQPSGKVIHAWAVRGDLDAAKIKSNAFTMEWPPRSGRRQEFPEIDRGAWFAIPEASQKLLPGQLRFLAELQDKVGSRA